MKRIEEATTGVVDRVQRLSIKSKIILFAIIATLIPALTMGWLSYRNNRRVLDEKLQVALSGLTSHAERELRLWLEERKRETRVLAGSYEVSENLEKLQQSGSSNGARKATRERLADYLARVSGRFPDYDGLIVLDLDGALVAASHPSIGPPELPERWLEQLREDGAVVVTPKPVGDETAQAAVAVVEPIHNANRVIIGAMASMLDLGGVAHLLEIDSRRDEDRLYAATARGHVIASSGDSPVDRPAAAQMPLSVVEAALESPDDARRFVSVDDHDVIGMGRRVFGTDWFVLAERDFSVAYADVHRLRDQTILLIVIVALAVGLLAYLLGLTIVRPLDRMVAGARRVAQGDFDVDLPVHGSNEINYLSSVFNRMVTSLRASQVETAAAHDALRERNTELQEEATRDGLTGLFNRKSFDTMLEREIAAARRHRRSVSILMFDVDHFKAFNDTHGHLAGDTALRAVADEIRATIRECDYAMRFGGEEFLVLSENDAEGAKRLGEKLRERIAALQFENGASVTISVGVATYAGNGQSGEELIAQADAALYASKRAGRNRVTLAGECESHHALERV